MKLNNNHIPKLPSNHIHKHQCGSEETDGEEAEGSCAQRRVAIEVPSIEHGGGGRGDWHKSSGIESGSEETSGDFRVLG
jgi:hypothetical protein